MRRLLRPLLDLFLLALSALGMWASFPPLAIWVLMIPALALCISVLDQVRPWRAGLYAGAWALAFFLPHISWMMVATGGIWAAWFALAGVQALAIGLWGASVSVLGTWQWARTVWGQPLGVALLWVAFEELRSRVPFGGFSWGRLGFAQVDSPLLLFAPLGGEALTAFVVVALAVLLRRALALPASHAPLGPWGRLAALSVGAVVFFGPMLWRLPTAQQEGGLRVGVVQGNVEPPMDATFAIPRKVTGNHVRETLLMAENEGPLDAVFWGENATDIDPRIDPQSWELVTSAADAVDAPMAIGIMEYTEDERFNWVGVWYPSDVDGGGPGPQLYGKQHPVPWGEYVPLRSLTLRLAPAATRASVDMVAVQNDGFLEMSLRDGRVLPVSVGICFEVAYQELIARGVALGGQLIYIPTNNAQFEDSPESLQQLQMTRFRAAQFSRSALQVSTNGVSAVVRPDGSVQAATPLQAADYLVETVPLRSSITPSVYLGGVLAWVAMVAGAFLAVASAGAHVYGDSLRRSVARRKAQRPTARRSPRAAKSPERTARGKKRK